MSNQWQFVIAAYTVTWVVLIGYAAYIEFHWHRARRAVQGGET